MPTSTVCFRFWGQDELREACVREGLAAGGIQLIPFGSGDVDQYGIVCFSRIDDGLFTYIDHLQHSPHPRVLALATSASALENGSAWRLLHVGAADVLVWRGVQAVEQILARLERWLAVERLADTALAQQSFVGESAAWRCLVRRVAEAGRFSNSPVLLTGESGTGKELLARLIHAVGSRTDGEGKRPELITIDCSTIVPELSGSELFGHERGAFTGAHSARDGAFSGATSACDSGKDL
jgi:Sigma-54 interaction domain